MVAVESLGGSLMVGTELSDDSNGNAWLVSKVASTPPMHRDRDGVSVTGAASKED